MRAEDFLPAVFVHASLPAVRLPLGDVLERYQDLPVVARVVFELVQQARLQRVGVRVVLRRRATATNIAK